MKRWISMILILACLLTCLPMTASAVKGGKLIALTFDDGPSVYTTRLLNGLQERNVKVTFFVIGQRAEMYPDIVRRAYDEGHQIAQHTYNHPALTTQSNEQIKWQLETTDAILDETLGMDMDYLLRTPYGDCNDRVLSQLKCPNIMWSLDSCDWQLLNAQKVCNKIVNNVFDGAIILVHDLHSTSVSGALEAIDILLERGYEFVTVNELFRRRGVEMKAGVNYYSCKPNGTDLGGLVEPRLRVDNERIIFSNIDPNGKLYYTVNGNVPTKNSPVYSNPIPLYDGTLRYCVIADGSSTPIRTFTVTKQGNLFSDVAYTAWYFDEVNRAVTLGLFKGTGDYAFEPEAKLTRAMFVTVLYRLMEQKGKDTSVKATSDFTDLSKKWYKTAVSWAHENELVKGYQDNTFRPDVTITREEMCAILDRTLTWLGESAEESEITFSDADSISDWAKQSVARVCSAGLITGHSNHTFTPQATATRAQAATVLLRLFDMV